MRAVRGGLPHPRADHDQRIRTGGRQQGEPDLDQGAAAGAAGVRHGAAAAPDAAGSHRARLLPARLDRGHGTAGRGGPGPSRARPPRRTGPRAPGTTRTRTSDRRAPAGRGPDHVDQCVGRVLGAGRDLGGRGPRHGAGPAGGVLRGAARRGDALPGRPLRHRGRAVPRLRADHRVHRRGADAVPVRAHDRRRERPGLPEGDDRGSQ